MLTELTQSDVDSSDLELLGILWFRFRFGFGVYVK